MLAEVVGSNLTQSIFIDLVNYGIKLILFFVSCLHKESIVQVLRMTNYGFLKLIPKDKPILVVAFKQLSLSSNITSHFKLLETSKQHLISSTWGRRMIASSYCCCCCWYIRPFSHPLKQSYYWLHQFLTFCSESIFHTGRNFIIWMPLQYTTLFKLL